MKAPQHQPDRFVRVSGFSCLAGLGGFMAWAGFAPLEEGVAASGQVIVENNRQVVQHFEGGIIDDVLVQEGETVEAGEVVLVLKDTASLSNRDQLLSKIAALAAKEARLQALAAGAAELDFAALDAIDPDPSTKDALAQEERQLFEQQRRALDAEIRVQTNRADAARRTIALRDEQISSVVRAREVTGAELSRMRDLMARKMTRRDQVADLERELADFDASLARLRSERSDAQAAIEGATREIERLETAARREASAELRDARAERLAAQETLTAAQDVLDRSVITAPVAGEVLNLVSTTQGGVVTSGDTLMEIVPLKQRVVASVRIRPTDRASVVEGQNVRTQISAYRSWRSPELTGSLETVSADLKSDPATGADYYEARILLSAETLEDADGLEVTPGMPVDVFIYSGRSRTTLDYLLEPVAASVFKGLRSS